MASIIRTQAWFNNSTHVCYEASRACVNGSINSDYDAQLKHIENRVKVGHESVIEHSNFVVAMLVPDDYIDELLEVVANCHYLIVKTKRVQMGILPGTMKKKINLKKKYNGTLVNIMGTIRGYKNLYRAIPNLANTVLRRITKSIYDCLPASYFTDMISDGIFADDAFLVHCEAENVHKEDFAKSVERDSDNRIEIINLDYLEDIYQSIHPDMLIATKDRYELADLLTITVKFKDLARFSSHQLVRHRNGITQESQRYVDFSSMPLNNPFEFEPDYDPNKTYNITLKDLPEGYHIQTQFTVQQLLDMLKQIYPQLKSQGMKAELARTFAPQTISAGNIYMTFTIRSLAKFFDLRCDKHAQAEIREYANRLFAHVSEIPALRDENFFYFYFGSNETAEDAKYKSFVLEPKYKVMENIDEEYEDCDVDDMLSEYVGFPEYIVVENNDGTTTSVPIDEIDIGKSDSQDL